MNVMQRERPIAVSSPLGEETLLFRRMAAGEQMSRLFTFELELLSEDPNIGIDDVLGQGMTVRLDMHDGSERHFDGLVSRFYYTGSSGRYATYRATLRPWLWFLTRTSDCRIFQDKTVPQIVEQIFAEHGFSDFEFRLTETYRTWTYCVQYRETDFNFVSRLLEQEGVYYYFLHKDGKHTLVLADSYSCHERIPGYDRVPYHHPTSSGLRERDNISDWSVYRDAQPGKYTLRDFDFEKPRANLEVRLDKPQKHARSTFEFYDYPGEYLDTGEGNTSVKLRLQELHARYEQVQGGGDARGLYPGGLFELEDHPRADQNREYLIVSANYEVESDEYEGTAAAREGRTFHCDFTAMDPMGGTRPFRAPRITPKPTVQGPQTAMVVGPAGEEIYTDKHGRVKVQFHWDREGKKDQDSSCWIRVSSPWAGKNWGGTAIPRIGQEVIVDFLEGDPDRPIITGRVYNSETTPPYSLPENKTQTGMKSRSSPGGAAVNFNELRFEDKKGSEQLFVHAEKNQDIEVKNDETHWIGHDRTKTIDNDETTHVKHDRTETVDNDETITIHGNRTETVDKDETITIHGNRVETVDMDETTTIHANRTETVDKDETITIHANRTETVDKNETITIHANRAETVDKNETITIGGARSEDVSKDEQVSIGQSRGHTVGKDDSLSVGKDMSVDVGKKLTVTAGDQIMIRTGAASITMMKSGDITISGSKITIKGTGNVIVKGKKILEN